MTQGELGWHCLENFRQVILVQRCQVIQRAQILFRKEVFDHFTQSQRYFTYKLLELASASYIHDYHAGR